MHNCDNTMSERPPETQVAPVEKNEQLPPTYEKALDAVRMLKVAGVENPFDAEDPRVVDGLLPLEEWYQSKNLHMRGVGSAEKASDIIKATLIFIEGGFDGTAQLRAALEKLNDEHADAMREEGSEEAVRLLRGAIEAIEEKLGARNPKEKAPAILEAKLEEAAELVAQGKGVQAVGVLTFALFDPRFKRLPKAQLARIEEMRDRYKALA